MSKTVVIKSSFSVSWQFTYNKKWFSKEEEDLHEIVSKGKKIKSRINN